MTTLLSNSLSMASLRGEKFLVSPRTPLKTSGAGEELEEL